MAASLAVVATVTTLVLLAPNSGSPEQRGAALARNVEGFDFNHPSPDTIFSNGKNNNFRRAMAQSQFAALPSLRQVLTHVKSDREKKIREMERRHRQRDASASNYEGKVQLKNDPELGSGQLPSSVTRPVQPPWTKQQLHLQSTNFTRTPDSHHVEEEITVQDKEEQDSLQHPQDEGSPATSQKNINPEIVAVGGKEANENHDKKMHEMDETSSNLIKNKTAQRLQTKESDRLPTRRLKNGSRVCETPECHEAATRIKQSLDRSVSPCDDFYQFACGGWINNHSLPESGWASTYIDAEKRLNDALLMILEKPAEPSAAAPLQEIRRLYNSCMDLNKLDEIGLDPLVNLLSDMGGWPMVEEAWDPDFFNLSTALNNLRNIHVYPLIHVFLNVDLFNTSQWLIFVGTGQVPIGVNYMASLSDNELTPYRTLMTTAATMLRNHVGSNVTDQDIDDQVHGVIEFERKFSQIVMTAVNETTNNAWQTTVAELQEDTDGGTLGQFNWLDFLKEIFAETDVTIIEDEPLTTFKGPFFKDLSNMLAITHPRTIANALGWWWVYNLQQETTEAMRDASYDYFHDFYGMSRLPSRQPHCLDITNSRLGFALSREYVDKFVPASVKPEVTEMVGDLHGAFSSLLDNNTWMLPGDLKVAQEKLAAMDSFVAYPDWIMDDEKLTLGYEGLELRDQEHMYNLVHIGRWYNLNSLAILRDVPQHSECCLQSRSKQHFNSGWHPSATFLCSQLPHCPQLRRRWNGHRT
ncbi:neprilysin-1-like isoform X4 [Eriocheir sinensis]|uniref:neprilysin-1-like isoform X4 n=1 Tax=Eriocheir sinensis TaxID=95602 RepID=UPI0021CAB575|nr:neprilysin-1-like isoform X4 [Eriocheir sinensis]XP_050717093.1 neprilysin-1-like isoform X4 [Eriocheir sinensis]